MLTLAIKESYFLFNCSLEYKPSYYKRYVDDIFVLCKLEIQVESSRNCMNTCHPKMKFTFEKAQNKCFNFLDVKVIRENNVFTTSIYRKPTFGGVYTHFDSYMLLNYKFSLASTIIFCSFTINFDMSKLHYEISKIKDIFIKNDHSERFIDKCIKTFLNEVFIPKRIIQAAEKKQVTIVLLYMGMILTELKIKLHETFKKLLPVTSLLVYNLKCNSCNAEYIAKTKRHYRTQTLEHTGVSPLARECVKNNSQTSAVYDHMLFCKTVVCPKDFSVLPKSSRNFKLEIQESILIKLLRPTLNKNVSSVPLYFF